MRWRLAAVLVGFTALVLLMQNVPLASYLRSVEGDRITTGLQRDAFTLAGYAVAPLQQPNPGPDPDLSRRVEAYAALGGARVVVIDSNYVAIASSEGKVGENYANRPEMVAALSGKAVSGERDSSTLGEKLLYVAVPVRAGQQILGAVRLTYPASEVNATVDRRVRSLAIAAAITLLAAALIAWLLASTITRRLRKLGAAAERIAEGDLSARADVGGGGEVQELAESFNTMAERVEQVVESQRGFAGDASHQLRTPLAELRSLAECALKWPESRDPATDQETLAIARQMERIVTNILAMVRGEQGQLEAKSERVAVTALVRDTWQRHAGRAEGRGLHASLRLDEAAGTATEAAQEAVEAVADAAQDNA